MTYTENAIDQTVKQSLEEFKQFDVDTQLALLWYGYLDLKDELHPAPGPSVTEPATALYDTIQNLPKEQQLQAQREMLSGGESEFSRLYNALAYNGRLETWLLLAQGMERGDIIGMPADYKLPTETDNFVKQIKQLNFEQRVSFSLAASGISNH